MSLTKIIANPKAAKTIPQAVRTRGDGFSSPADLIIASVKPALTTLVTTKRKAAKIVVAWVTPLSGNCCNSAKVVASRLTLFISISELSPRKALKKPTPPKTPNQTIENNEGATITPIRNSRIVRPREIRAIKMPTKGDQASHQIM